MATGRESAEICECVRLRWLKQRLRTLEIPAEYEEFSIENFVPDPARHPEQAAIIAHLRANPKGSMILQGRHGTGKSLFGWIDVRRAIQQGYFVIAMPLAEMLHKLRQYESNRAGGDLPCGLEHCLSGRMPVYLFLDEFDQTRINEWVGEALEMILNGIYRHRHRLFITTNLNLDALTDHLSSVRVDNGLAMLRKMLELRGMRRWELK